MRVRERRERERERERVCVCVCVYMCKKEIVRGRLKNETVCIEVCPYGYTFNSPENYSTHRRTRYLSQR